MEKNICVQVYGPNKVPYSTNLHDIRFSQVKPLQPVCKLQDIIIDRNGNLKIEFTLTDRTKSAFALLTNAQTGEKVLTHNLDITVKEATIDVSSLPSGIYVISLIADDNLVDSQKINL